MEKLAQKNYQIIHFNKIQLAKLTSGISETLKSSPETVTPGGNAFYRLIKRTMDLILSLSALLVLSPLFIITALIIFIDDPGNPFFVQYRLTENGKAFHMNIQ